VPGLPGKVARRLHEQLNRVGTVGGAGAERRAP
jgi:hypothetical protein